jgi:hypothetical protein
MAAHPDVSVVIPVHDRPEALEKALASALAQRFDGTMEIVIVDDASRIPVPDRDEPRLRIVRHEVNRGAAEARNTGIREARGEFIAFLDSDDVWEPGKLAAQLDMMRSGPADLIGVFTPYAFVHRPQKRIGPPGDVDDWFFYFLGGCRVGPGSTLLFRRSLATAIGDQDPSLPRFEDWDWLLRAAQLGRFALVPGPGALLTLSGRPAVETVSSCIARMEQRWLPRLDAAQGRRFRAALEIERAAVASWNGKRLAMILHLARALRHDPACFARELGNRLAH